MQPMRFKEKRFSLPFAALTEPMPSKAFKLLVYLFRETDFSGFCNPGYAEMQSALKDDPAENGSPSTVRRYLAYLEKRGWIFHMKRTNGKMGIWLQIPPRFKREKREALPPISVLSRR